MLSFNPGGLWADCLICDEIITLDAARAACFVRNYEAVSEKLAATPTGRTSIDLDACSVEGEALDTRAGLATLPRMNSGDAPGATRGKSVYLLDAQGAACLHDLIKNHPSSLDPSVMFDLFEDCPNE
jgi:hypothetical protein